MGGRHLIAESGRKAVLIGAAALVAVVALVLLLSAGGGRDLSEEAMAGSLERAQQESLPDTNRALREIFDDQGLSYSPYEVRRGSGDCRSRESTPSKKGVPFVCVITVESSAGSLRYGYLVDRVRDDGCWEAIADRVSFDDGDTTMLDPDGEKDPSDLPQLEGCA